jgi:Ca2+:H+ antiporter
VKFPAFSLKWLLVFVPAAITLRYVPGWRNDSALFVMAGLGIIPLAGIMGEATEQLSHRLGQGLGGLLNATFGNAAELIIALLALKKGLIDVVKASITGSILGNILLVFGASALAGGLKYRQQSFNRTAMKASTVSLLLAAIGLLMPTVFHYTSTARFGFANAVATQRLSLGIALVLFVTYICSLIFSLGTHKQLYSGGESETAGFDLEETWSVRRSITALLMATVLVALLSEILVSSIEAARKSLHVTEVFIGIIVVAIIGNAAEHSTAVWMARKNKMDLSLNIAIGSSLQIALFVAPLLLFVSYLFGHPMTLEFSIPEVVSVLVAVHVVSQISNDGETNWLEGAQLLCLYLILAILFFFLPASGH